MIESPDILQKLREIIIRGSGLLGAFDRSIVPRERTLELIDWLLESLPEEMEEAIAIQEKREEIIERATQQGGEIIDEAVRRAEKMIDADAITKGAKQRAEEIMDEADEYILERLRGLEDELQRVLKEVRKGIKAIGSGEVPHDVQE